MSAALHCLGITKKLFAIAALLWMVLMFSMVASAQTNYVYINNQTSANSVVAYSVSPAGVLTAVPGSPFSTHGTGAAVNCYALDRMTISAPNSLLFVANTGNMTISSFTINPANGALTLVAGSPFATGLTFDSCQGMSIAATPDGKFLMASSNGQIMTFGITATGVLTAAPLFTTSTCCTPLDSMKISVNGQFLALADSNGVSMFTINADGSLTAVPGSPFPKTGTGALAGLDFNSCSANLLYGGEAIGATPTITDAWSVSGTGALSALAGSPYHTTGANSNVVLLSPDNRWLFESNQTSASVNTFSVAADGTLTSVGKFGGTGTVHVPAGMATDRSGTFLYVADDGVGLALFRINADGSLTSIKDQTVNTPAEIQSVAAYPPRSCTSANVSVTMTASPNPVSIGSNVTYNITVSNAGPDAAAITLQDSFPTSLGSITCSITPSTAGTCVGTLSNRNVSIPALASGASATVKFTAQVRTTVANNTTIKNTVSVSNSSAIDPDLSDNSATVTVTAVNTALTTLTVAPASGAFGGTVNLSATLKKSSDSSAVAGRTVNFFLQNSFVGAGVTDSTGLASVSNVSLGNIAVGTYPGAIFASFAGDSTFAQSTGRAQLTVTSAALTVTADNQSRAYGDPNPNFTYTITGFQNGDTQSVVSGSANCTTAATAASTPGNYPITCTQGTLSASNYSFVFVNGTLTVTAASLTVQAANATRLYGDANPAFTGTITGVKNGDSITATYATSATPASAPGAYAIVPTLVDPNSRLGNYTVTVISGTLTVNPAPLSVQAANASRNYGDPNPAFTGTITGIKNGDNISASYTTTATASSPAGTYAITPVVSDPDNKLSNYAVTLSNGTLTVNQAGLLVTAGAASRVYGDANPAFTYTITGFVNGDTQSVVSGTANCTTTATAASAAGTYPINCTQGTLAAANYTFSFAAGTLTIAPAPLTVTAADATRVYGDPNPGFTGTIAGLKNGDNITATYASADVTAAVGTYPIVPALVDPTNKLGNYTVTSTNGTLTITPAPLSVAAGNVARIYGDPNPSFGGTITGLKNGDNITATYSTTADVSSPVGTYTIVPVLVDPTNKLGNYTVSSTNGTLTITTASLTITPANATRIYGDPNPAFTGTITGLKNGDSITATYSSNSVVTDPAGTYQIFVASISDPTGKLSNYTLTTNTGVLTVTRAPLAVAAANATRVYGDPNPAFTGTITGLKNGDNITATYSSVADPTSPAGNYPIVPALSDPTNKLGNYSVTVTNGTLTITPAPLTAVAANTSRLYGDPNPTFTGTLSGLKNGDNITATFTSAADATSPVGSYPITPSFTDPNNKLGNYTVTASGTLTVNPAPLTVNVNSAARVYGDPNPVFSGTITGLKNGDNITANFVSVDQTAAVGSYPITPNLVDPNNKLGNYAVTVNPGTLTITPAPLTVTAADATRLYGDPNPPFFGTIAGLKNGDNITATYSSPADPASAVGTYPIVPALVDPTNKLGNYTVTANNGTLTVNLAPLTIQAADATKNAGDPNPVFTGTITGTKNNDTITATYSSPADATSPAGQYPIIPSADPSPALNNYSVTLINGTLTVQ